MKDLDKKIVVEPLDEIRLARIERSLPGGGRADTAQATGQRRVRWAWPATAAALAAALIVVVWRGGLGLSPGTQLASEFSIEGGEAPSTVAVGGARLEVGEGARARVQVERDVATRVRIGEGRMRFVVEPRKDRPVFTVEAADALVTVVGTVFSVERRGKEVSVDVERGKVLVTRRGEGVQLLAGQSWATQSFIASTTPVTVPVGAGHVSDTDPAVVVPSNRGGEATSKSGSATSSRSRQVTKVASSSRPAAKPAAKPVAKAKAAHFAPYRAPSTLDPIMKAPAGSSSDVENYYREQSLVRGNSQRAAFAVYSTAYWQLYRMGNARAALHSAKLYERRFRRGKNAESVLWVRLAALCASGKDSECRAAAHSYNRRYPGGPFARQVKAVINREAR